MRVAAGPRRIVGRLGGFGATDLSRVSRSEPRETGPAYRQAGILIPPRQPGAPTHEVAETATEYLVRVIFPVAVSLAALRWELTGDVLEVEYAAPGLHYYENFLIPVTSTPKVSVGNQVFEARFPKVA